MTELETLALNFVRAELQFHDLINQLKTAKGADKKRIQQEMAHSGLNAAHDALVYHVKNNYELKIRVTG